MDIIEKKWISYFKRSDIKNMRIILENCGNSIVDLPDYNGHTALIHASSDGNVDIIKLLIDYKANLDLPSIGGWTPLIHASYYTSNTKVVKLLIDSKVDLDLRDCSGKTALMHALYNGYIKKAKLLIEAGANIFIEDKEQKTCLHHALHKNNIEMVEYLLKKGLTFGVNKHIYYEKINEETHEFFKYHEGYQEYKNVNEEK